VEDSTNPADQPLRRCPRCWQSKPLDQFYKRPNKCKPCTAEYNKNRRSAWREDREAALQRKFGITLHQYEKMLWDQEGLCAICGRPQSGKRGGVIIQLCVDHDHETGQVRALLCTPCNIGLGNFGDDVERLMAAIRYLRKWGKAEAI
jgi:hypothetical protein